MLFLLYVFSYLEREEELRDQSCLLVQVRLGSTETVNPGDLLLGCLETKAAIRLEAHPG